MQTVNVEIPPSDRTTYPIFIGDNILENCGCLIKPYINAQKVLLVSNNTIFSLYGEILEKSFTNAGFGVEILLLEDGEQYKNTLSLEKIWTKAIETGLERKDAMIAVGGGVIGDITGFAAGTYLRGIDFIQIPTTLLAQVDSSVGGKVAVNHRLGKNLIGNFYQPKAVLADIATLKTLPARELKVGLAEVLKYGFIEETCGLKRTDIAFIDYLQNNKENISSLEPVITKELIKYCCELKASVVNKDEKEAGLRAILNFGHTIGHAIEKCYGYQDINHGEAVAIGMRGAFIIARNREIIDKDYFFRAIDLLKGYGMDYKINVGILPESLYAAMTVDKKVQEGKIRFVLPVGVSKVDIFNDLGKDEVIEALKNLY